MRIHGLSLWLALWLAGSVQAVDNLRLPDARALATGGEAPVRSPEGNPASLVGLPGKTFHLSYTNRYRLRELGTLSGGFYLPHPTLSAGIHIATFGFDRYRATMTRLSLAKRVGKRWAAGIAIQYRFLQSELTDSPAGRLSADIGATFSPVDKLLIGLLISDLPSFRTGNREIDTEDFRNHAVRFGFQWEVLNDLWIIFHTGTERDHPLMGGAGVEYRAFDRFFLRAGVRTDPLLPAFGVGWQLAAFRIDAAAVYHPVLGMSTGVDLSFIF